MAQRAVWVWDRAPAANLIRFAQSHAVQDLFLAVPDNLPSSEALPWVRAVVDAARPSSIRPHALGGDPGWIDDPAKAVNWQRAALSTGLFVGSHVDLEAWRHPGWETDRAATVTKYLLTLDVLAAVATVPLEADITFWLHTVLTPNGQPLDAAVLACVDRVTVMSFRNTVTGPDGITEIAAPTLAAARAAGRPVRLAVETSYLGDDPVSRKQTFYGQTSEAMFAAMARVDKVEAPNPSYAGISVQHCAAWAAMRRERRT